MVSIANETSINNIAIIFLNRQFGFAARLKRLMTDLPPTTMSESMSDNQAIYTNILVNHHTNDAGRIVATKITNVGEQVLNIGPSRNHNIISHQYPWKLVEAALWVRWLKPKRWINRSQAAGNNNTKPKIPKIVADHILSRSWRNHKNCTIHCKLNVNTNTDIANAPIINRGRYLFSSLTDPQRITGRIGNTHGANTVNTPAINESNKVYINKL